jgi:serine/threonine-protein kinase
VTPERWREVDALFQAALERAPQDRDALLGEVAARDPQLASEVRSLLAHVPPPEFLETPAWAADPSVLDPAPLTGRRVGPYLVGEELGRGGMGIVYAAEDMRLSRPVALKALPPEYTRDAGRRARLRREARAAAGLSHPRIATVYALEEIDGDLYIVSELVRGRTLRAELAAGPVAPGRLTSTLVDIASALAAAHALGIVHRDLKPENLVRRDDGHVTVLDFGLAREWRGGAQPQLTVTGTALGTPGYAAPEQWSGGTVDARADIFSFGVVAWELATGQHPFGSDPATMAARMAAFLDGRPVSGPSPGGHLEAVARRCMRGDPADRFENADALLAALQDGRLRPAGASSDRLWWWRFHQGAAASVDAALAGITVAARSALMPEAGRWIRLAVLVLATAAVTIRLHLLFAARVHPESVAARRAALSGWLAASEGVMAAVIVFGVAAFGTDGVNGPGWLLVALAVASAASLLVVEPWTTTVAGLDRAGMANDKGKA